MQMSKWVPDEESMKSLRLVQWMEELNLPDYDSFYQKSIQEPEWFWSSVEKELGFVWKKPYEEVLNLDNGIARPHWYVGGECNLVDTALAKWAETDRMAILWEGEQGEVREYTYAELHAWVSQVASGLQKAGIQKGDRITLFMPMIPEAAVSILAAAKIGAIISPIFSGYAEEALKTRVIAAGAKMIITADSFLRRGKQVDMLQTVRNALPELGGVETIVVVGGSDLEAPFMDWSRLEEAGSLEESVRMKSDDPFMLIYTSGTTGKPKGTVHTHAGFPIKAAIDARVAMDLVEGDRLLWVTDMGWMMGPFQLFASLMNGAAMVMYDGVPDYPESDRLWKLVHKWRVTQLGISPTLIRSLMAKGEGWLDGHDLSSLKVFASTGEPWNSASWLWLFQQAGKCLIPIINYSGGTEISGGILGNVLVKPITPAAFNTPLPGMEVVVLDENGQQVVNKVGELCLTKPWVGMTNGFWNEPERYIKTYWSTYDGYWVHGDWVETDGESWEIKGRSDDTLNIAGKRVGPTEYESILVKHEDVVEAAAIGIPDSIKGEACLCFAVLKGHVKASKLLEDELLEMIGHGLGKALKPKGIYFLSDLPKTRNQKIMRRVIKSAYLQQEPGDLSSLVNPEVVREIALCNEEDIAGNHRSEGDMMRGNQ